MADKLQIKQFLDEMKASGSAFGFIFANRNKNNETYLELELNAKMREQVLQNLQIEDYYQGPEHNTEFGTNPMWVFGKEVKGREIYIKITIPISQVVCISFHISEFPMTYPFK